MPRSLSNTARPRAGSPRPAARAGRGTYSIELVPERIEIDPARACSSATWNARLACLDDEVVAARAVVEVDDAWNAERCALSSRPIDAVRRVGSDDADDRQDPG